MLRNVCDKCNEVIDGEPVQREYPEAVLLVDDEVVVMYENLCDGCRRALVASVKSFGNPPARAVRQVPSPAPEPQPTAADAAPAETEAVEDAERELANKVVKQYPIHLPSHD